LADDAILNQSANGLSKLRSREHADLSFFRLMTCIALPLD
jgi:hypothetical protein